MDSIYENYQGMIDRAAGILGLERSQYEFAKYPEREMIVSIPVEMDDGTILVFDGYRVPGGAGEEQEWHGIHVVYTKEKETADMYLERRMEAIGKKERGRIVTSDRLIQLAAVRAGILRMSAREFEEAVQQSREELRRKLERINGCGEFGSPVWPPENA